MAGSKVFRDPAILFTLGALCLFGVGVAAWLAASPAPAGAQLAGLGNQLCRAAAVFGICAALYFLFTRTLHWKMSELLGQVHFWLSALAAILQPLLTVSFSLSDHPVPGHSAISLLMDTLVGTTAASVWALLVFVLAQLVFLANLCWTFLNALSGKNGATPTV